MAVDVWMPCMRMLILMTFALIQGHRGSAKPKNQLCTMLSATNQAISIKLATTVGNKIRDLDLDFANVYTSNKH